MHVIEQYLTYPVNAPIQDRFAEAILITLIEEGPKVYANPADYEAMANLMWSATMALNGIIMCGVPGDWSVHSIGHELTALHGIDHARTLAIVLPGLWKTLRAEKRAKKLLQYGRESGILRKGLKKSELMPQLKRLRNSLNHLALKPACSDYGVKEDTIEEIVKTI